MNFRGISKEFSDEFQRNFCKISRIIIREIPEEFQRYSQNSFWMNFRGISRRFPEKFLKDFQCSYENVSGISKGISTEFPKIFEGILRGISEEFLEEFQMNSWKKSRRIFEGIPAEFLEE